MRRYKQNRGMWSLGILAICALAAWSPGVGEAKALGYVAPSVVPPRQRGSDDAAEARISGSYFEEQNAFSNDGIGDDELAAAVQKVNEEQLAKKETCKKRHGDNFYYNNDIHSCEDCYDSKCNEIVICARECKDVFESDRAHRWHIGLLCGLAVLFIIVFFMCVFCIKCLMCKRHRKRNPIYKPSADREVELKEMSSASGSRSTISSRGSSDTKMLNSNRQDAYNG